MSESSSGAAQVGRYQTIHLNAVAAEHLVRIRTDRELLFPWPLSLTEFNRHWHKLLTAAGVARQDHFALCSIRPTAGTILWVLNPKAARLCLGHQDAATTIHHYVAGQALIARALDDLPEVFVARGLDALPQPAAFAGGIS